MIPRLIEPIVVSYLKSQIGSSSVRSIKIGLQHLCDLYRSGNRLRAGDRVAMEQLTIGALYTHGQHDEKVRRWALNAIARIGRPQTSAAAITHALQSYTHDPQTAASAIAALFALQPNEAYDRLRKEHDFPEEVIVLSGLQHAHQSALNSSPARININSATVDVLKLALVAIGLNRAPEHIFDPQFANSVIVKDLGGHNDHIVSQYSVWAISENPMLGIKDLGIPLQDIEFQPPNVRSWMYRLIATTEIGLEDNLPYIELGANDPDADARAGLAMGLGQVFYDGIQPLVLDWYGQEQDDDIRLRLLDHIVCQAEYSPSYESLALDVYKSETTSNQLRERMEAAAAGRKLYSAFMRYSYTGSATLFDALSGGITVVTNKINITGNVTGSAIAQGGDASTSNTNSHFNIETIHAIQSELSKAQKEVHVADIDPKLKADLLALIAEGSAKPTPEKLSPIMGGLKKVISVLGQAGKATTALAAIILALAKLGII